MIHVSSITLHQISLTATCGRMLFVRQTDSHSPQGAMVKRASVPVGTGICPVGQYPAGFIPLNLASNLLEQGKAPAK
jgi:hypothetical protein